MKKAILIVLAIALVGIVFFKIYRVPVSNVFPIVTTITVTPTPIPTLPPLPTANIIENDYQIFQTFNNCGPAALSMALSYYGINKSQLELGQELRPYQNPQGNNDDKSVTLDELAKEAEKFNLLAYVRPHGNVKLLKTFIAQGIPVIIETTLTESDDIGHFRVVKGYDDTIGVIIQDDSMQGHNIQFSQDVIDNMWKQYDYEYLVLVPKEKQQIAEAILGNDLNEKIAWQEAAAVNQQSLVINPNDVNSRFNFSVALYHLGSYQESVSEFEKIENKLPFRTLWYQIEPIEAYFALENYQRVFALTDEILNNGNRAFSELYIIRGKIYQKQGNMQAARAEFEKAVFYNVNMQLAQQLLQSAQ
jgi:tetratricopeptide (TPR) repeat protein